MSKKRRGKPGNNRLPVSVRALVMTIIQERYPDFGPTLATEKLRENHGCPVSRETVRKWMMEEGLWLDRRRRLPSVHQPRNRQERMGELIQIDGSKHWWFENRGPQCTLLAYIDDATSRLMHAAFVPSESTFDYLRETHRYVSAHGRPIAFYSDKHAIFRVSNRHLHPALRAMAMSLVQEHYADFGPTLAAEKLAERHYLRVGRETLRKWMMEDGLWLDRRRRLPSAHPPRYRRDCIGELVQIDGSEHWWLEDRGPRCTLIVFIDDATSRLVALRFVPSEGALAYFETLKSYMISHRRPLAFYSDKHSIFRLSKAQAQGGQGMTQFGRDLSELGIGILCANSSQAKGRLERANQTLQDRLIKEMRLEGISTIEAANAFVPRFMEDHNARLACAPFDPRDPDRPLSPHDNLDDTFAWKEERTVTHNRWDESAYICKDPSNGSKPVLKESHLL